MKTNDEFYVGQLLFVMEFSHASIMIPTKDGGFLYEKSLGLFGNSIVVVLSWNVKRSMPYVYALTSREPQWVNATALEER